jgi:hypothetical protein
MVLDTVYEKKKKGKGKSFSSGELLMCSEVNWTEPSTNCVPGTVLGATDTVAVGKILWSGGDYCL